MCLVFFPSVIYKFRLYWDWNAPLLHFQTWKYFSCFWYSYWFWLNLYFARKYVLYKFRTLKCFGNVDSSFKYKIKYSAKFILYKSCLFQIFSPYWDFSNFCVCDSELGSGPVDMGTTWHTHIPGWNFWDKFHLNFLLAFWCLNSLVLVLYAGDQDWILGCLLWVNPVWDSVAIEGVKWFKTFGCLSSCSPHSV